MSTTTPFAKTWHFDDIPADVHSKAPPQTGTAGNDSDERSDETQSSAGETASELSGPVAKQLGTLVRPGKDDPSELLKHRFLCRGSGLLATGPTGVGKSTLILQCAGAWAVGRPAFGIAPVRPLTSLVIQAENDEGDMAEFRDGIIAGLRLNPAEAKLAGERILVCREDVRTSLLFLEEVVRPLLREHRPDLAVIDPALAFLGGDTNSQKDVANFLRTGLQPLLREFDCGAIITHHTSKPPAVKARNGGWRGTELAYSGSGSAEWANWPRAVLALEGTGTPGEFRLHAAKRGGRLSWREPDGETPLFQKILRHSRKPGVICWEEIDVAASPAVPEIDQSRDVLVALVPVDKAINKALLIQLAKSRGVSEAKARPLIDQLIHERVLHLEREHRSGTNKLQLISRSPVSPPKPA